MSSTKVKLTYLASQYRVKAEINLALCLASDSPPLDVFERAHNKMQEIQRLGEVDFFSVYTDRFYELWRLCRQSTRLGENETVAFTLAEGAPLLEAVRLERASDDKALASLSIIGDLADIRSWRLEWLVYGVNHTLRQWGESQQINPAQLHGAWLRAAAGEEVVGVLLGPNPSLGSPLEIKEKPYSIVANKARKEIILIIRDLAAVTQAISAPKVIALVEEASKKMSQHFGGSYQVFKKEMAFAIQQAASGPEMLGLQLPLVLLGASAAVRLPAPLAPEKLQYSGAGKLHILVSQDGMEAKVTAFSKELYKDKSFTMDGDWLRNEVRRHGIAPEMSQQFLSGILKRIATQDDIEGVLVAIGSPSRAGNQPYLHASYKDSREKELVSKAGDVDLRSLQQRDFAKEGQLVAEVRYKTPPVRGKDVYGSVLEPPSGQALPIELGEGIVEKLPGKYYAAFDGVPIIDKQTVALTKVMIHTGDVNLRSGHIVFDGSVEISGSIDSGAQVYVTGDLKVKGSVRNGLVRCGGCLEVGDGIVTGPKGLVVVKKDIKAEFIENSNIQCGGSLAISKAIINSNVICGGKISVLDPESGVVAGGIVSCRYDLSTANLGFKHGNLTELNIGVDWQIELSVRIRQGRIIKVKEVQNKDRLALREIMSRKKQQMTEKHEERKKYFQDRLVKARALLEKMEAHLENAKAKLVFDQNVKVFVSETVYANINAYVGGSPVMVHHDYAGVVLLGKRRQGSQILPIETVRKWEVEADDA